MLKTNYRDLDTFISHAFHAQLAKLLCVCKLFCEFDH